MNLENQKIAHLFHWPAAPEYQRTLLQVIALPVGAKGQMYYKKKRVDEKNVKEINKTGFDATFWVLSCGNGRPANKFNFACPIRLLKILNVEEETDKYNINFIAQEFLSPFKKIDNLNDLKKYFTDVQIPLPCIDKGLIHIGQKIETLEKSPTVSLVELYKVLENIPCLSNFKEGIKIEAFPLVQIKLKDNKPDEDGIYKLSANQAYEVSFSYHQGDDYRFRPVAINGKEFDGQTQSDTITLDGIKKNANKIDTKVECGSLRFTIPLNVHVIAHWYEWRFVPLFILAIISVIFIFIYISLFPESDNKTINALIFPLIVMILGKFWEVLTKKD